MKLAPDRNHLPFKRFITSFVRPFILQNGDVIEVLEHVSADWLMGRLNGKTGKFPKAFVDIR